MHPVAAEERAVPMTRGLFQRRNYPAFADGYSTKSATTPKWVRHSSISLRLVPCTAFLGPPRHGFPPWDVLARPILRLVRVEVSLQLCNQLEGAQLVPKADPSCPMRDDDVATMLDALNDVTLLDRTSEAFRYLL